MNLLQMKYFIAIVDAGSVSKAAQALRVAQPSLSQHIRNLESELGVQLLSRHPRGVTPTAIGQVLYPRARAILEDLESVEDEIRTAAATFVGEVAVGITPALSKSLVVPLLEAAAKQLPQVSLRITTAMSGHLDSWIDTGQLDVALLYERESQNRVRRVTIGSEELMLVRAEGRPAEQEGITFEQLTSIPLVLPGPTQVIRQVLETEAQRAGYRLNVTAECDGFAGILELVMNGSATVRPSLPIARARAEEELVYVPITDPTPFWQLSVVQSEASHRGSVTDAIAGILSEIAEDFVFKNRTLTH